LVGLLAILMVVLPEKRSKRAEVALRLVLDKELPARGGIRRSRELSDSDSGASKSRGT
jgi:hypothetical protein